MAEHVRVGVVGTSGWANLAYIPGLKALPGAQLVAICGQDRARAEERARQYGIPRVFTDYREMIPSARGPVRPYLPRSRNQNESVCATFP